MACRSPRQKPAGHVPAQFFLAGFMPITLLTNKLFL